MLKFVHWNFMGVHNLRIWTKNSLLFNKANPKWSAEWFRGPQEKKVRHFEKIANHLSRRRCCRDSCNRGFLLERKYFCYFPRESPLSGMSGCCCYSYIIPPRKYCEWRSSSITFFQTKLVFDRVMKNNNKHLSIRWILEK